MRNGTWLEGWEWTVVVWGAGMGLLWVLVGGTVALQGWLPTVGGGSWNVAPPTPTPGGAAQVLLLLPVYLGFATASVLRIERGDLVLGLVLGWGLLLGMLGGLLLVARARRR